MIYKYIAAGGDMFIMTYGSYETVTQTQGLHDRPLLEIDYIYIAVHWVFFSLDSVDFQTNELFGLYVVVKISDDTAWL